MNRLVVESIAAVVARAVTAVVINRMYKTSAPDPLQRRYDAIGEQLAGMTPDSMGTEYSNPIVRTSGLTTDTVLSTGKTREEIGEGCLPCAQAHFATISGTLGEALRFARDPNGEGIMHPEVQSRLTTAEEDVTIIERHDWTPSKIINSPQPEQEAIRELLPKLRELRQDIFQIKTVNDLEAVSAKAQSLNHELRQKVYSLGEVESSEAVTAVEETEEKEAEEETCTTCSTDFETQAKRIVELLMKVKKGDITREEALTQLRAGRGENHRAD